QSQAFAHAEFGDWAQDPVRQRIAMTGWAEACDTAPCSRCDLSRPAEGPSARNRRDKYGNGGKLREVPTSMCEPPVMVERVVGACEARREPSGCESQLDEFGDAPRGYVVVVSVDDEIHVDAYAVHKRSQR